MGIIVPIGYSSANAGVVSTSITLSVPSGAREHDLFVVHLTSVSNPTSMGGSGWKKHDGTNIVGNTIADGYGGFASRAGYLWYRFLPASPPASYTITFVGRVVGGAATYRNVDLTTPVDAFAALVEDFSSGAAIAITQVTTSRPSCHLVTAVSGAVNNTWSTPTGMTERWDIASAGADYVSNALWDELLVNAGATGTRSTTPSAATARAGINFALRPGTPWRIGRIHPST